MAVVCCSVAKSDPLQPQGLQHARLHCPSPSLGACSNSYPLSRWYHPAFSSSVIPFSSCLQSFPASGSFQMSQFFTSAGQSIGVSASASVLSMNIRDWFPLGWTGWISLQAKRLSRVFSNSTVQKHQFFGTQFSSQSNSHIHTWLLETLVKALKFPTSLLLPSNHPDVFLMCPWVVWDASFPWKVLSHQFFFQWR